MCSTKSAKLYSVATKKEPKTRITDVRVVFPIVSLPPGGERRCSHASCNNPPSLPISAKIESVQEVRTGNVG